MKMTTRVLAHENMKMTTRVLAHENMKMTTIKFYLVQEM